MIGDLPLIFGVTMADSSVEMNVSRMLKYTRKEITPMVSGFVVARIGI